jgi:hypothetical protein
MPAQVFTHVCCELQLTPEAAAFAVELNAVVEDLSEGDLDLPEVAARLLGMARDCGAPGRDATQEQAEAAALKTMSGDVAPSGCTFAVDPARPGLLRVESVESADVDVVAGVLQVTLLRFPALDCASFEWAEVSDPPEPGAVGGGAAFVTREGVEWLDTGKWVAERVVARRRLRARP